jgi:hypothetical protein
VTGKWLGGTGKYTGLSGEFDITSTGNLSTDASYTQIAGKKMGSYNLYEAGAFPVVAMQGATPALVERHRREPVFRPDPEQPLSRVGVRIFKAVRIHKRGRSGQIPAMTM